MLEVIPLLIPILALSIPCLAIWTKHQSKMAELQLQMRAENPADADAYARLEERIRVLERIVTDRGSDLAAQIEALREESPALQAQRAAQLQATEVRP